MGKNKFIKYWVLFITFLKASAFTFGGGLAIITLIERDMVEKHRLLSKDEFMEYATLSQTMPGVIALNCATLVGRHAAGMFGMLAAGFGAILPTLVLMVAATVLAEMIPQQGPLMGAMRGIRAASAALVVSAAISLGKYNIKAAFSIILMIAAFLLAVLGSLGAPTIVVLSGAAGCVYQRVRRHRERRRGDAS
ncbi:chromate transporter [Bacillota bacterium Meth-B3]|nr:chromate transporter [Christensenellaceae bacterium]